jgi:DNA replication protein DnaC
MSVVIHARVVEQLTRLRLRYVADRLDAVLNDAARTEPTYLDFLDGVLRQEVDAKQRTRVAIGLKIAHFPTVKTLEDFDFTFQPSVDQRLVRELATARFLAQADNVLIFGAPGVGKTHLAIALGRAVVEAGHSVLFTSATALLSALSKADTDGQLSDRLMFYTKPKLLIIDELGGSFPSTSGRGWHYKRGQRTSRTGSRSTPCFLGSTTGLRETSRTPRPWTPMWQSETSPRPGNQRRQRRAS